ncbi:MAG TPA: HEAT repeat domain-containing protein [Planctomycetota bacterium]|nr:HEAT repeat domain-containing protein [Planctomycetota bacterium]
MTVLAAVISARVASRPQAEPVRGPAFIRTAPVDEAVKPTAVPAFVDVEAAPVSTPAEPMPDEVRLRALLGSEENFAKLKKVFEGIPDRALKLKLLREAVCGKDPRGVYAALSILREMKGRDVAEVLEVCLRTQEAPGYAGYAAALLGDVGDALSYTTLTDALRSKYEEIRVNSASSLRKLGYPAPADELALAYARQFESADGSLRKKSVETLVLLNLEGSIAVLVRALKDSNGDVRREGLNAFSLLDRKEYLPLLEPLVYDPNPSVAEEAKELVEGLKSRDN